MHGVEGDAGEQQHDAGSQHAHHRVHAVHPPQRPARHGVRPEERQEQPGGNEIELEGPEILAAELLLEEAILLYSRTLLR